MKALAWAPIAHRRLPKVAAAAPSIAWAPCTSTATADDVAQRLSTPDAAYATARETARGVVDVLWLADVLSGVAVAAMENVPLLRDSVTSHDRISHEETHGFHPLAVFT